METKSFEEEYSKEDLSKVISHWKEALEDPETSDKTTKVITQVLPELEELLALYKLAEAKAHFLSGRKLTAASIVAKVLDVKLVDASHYCTGNWQEEFKSPSKILPCVAHELESGEDNG